MGIPTVCSKAYDHLTLPSNQHIFKPPFFLVLLLRPGKTKKNTENTQKGHPNHSIQLYSQFLTHSNIQPVVSLMLQLTPWSKNHHGSKFKIKSIKAFKWCSTHTYLRQILHLDKVACHWVKQYTQWYHVDKLECTPATKNSHQVKIQTYRHQ